MTKNVSGGHLVFQNEAKNNSSQDFVMRNYSMNLRSLPIKPFALVGQQKSLL